MGKIYINGTDIQAQDTMKSCRIDYITIALYRRGKTSPRMSRFLDSHIPVCPECKAKAADSRRLLDACSSMPDVPLSADYDLTFRRKLSERIALLRERDVIRNISERIRNIELPYIGFGQVPALAKAAAAVALIFALAAGGIHLLSPVAPSVILARGTAQIYDAKTGGWITAESGTNIYKGNILRTDNSGAVDIGVENKYAIRLGSDAVIALNSISGTRDKTAVAYDLQKGLLLGSTEEEFKGSALSVLTANGEAIVRGTKFLIDARNSGKTVLAVLEGSVEFTNRALIGEAAETVTVGEGLESAVSFKASPGAPGRVGAELAGILMNAYDIGAPPRVVPSIKAAEGIDYKDVMVALVISDVTDRAKSFLEHGVYWTNDKELKPVNKLLAEAQSFRLDGEEYDNSSMHGRAIKKLETILSRYPDDRYNPQFMLFIGAYYHFLGDYDDAIDRFERVANDYWYTELAGIARNAIGIVYEEDLRNYNEAKKAYHSVIVNYPYTPEAKAAEERLLKLQ